MSAFVALVLINVVAAAPDMPLDQRYQISSMPAGNTVEDCLSFGGAFGEGLSLVMPGATISLYCIDRERMAVPLRTLLPQKQWPGDPAFIMGEPLRR